MGKEITSVNYDRISKIYDTGRAAHPETVEKLVRLLGIAGNSKILDMGCGTGNYTWALYKTTKNIIGLDYSFGMLEQAKAKYTEIPFLQGDVTDLSLESETFDGTLAIQVLHHIKQKERFLREAHRVMRKQAHIALHACSHEQMRVYWFYHYFPRGLDVDLARMPDSLEIALLLEKAGFTKVGIEICYRDAVVADEKPQSYLDKSYRDSISTFSFLREADIQSGCTKILDDITSGGVTKIVQQSENDIATRVGGSYIIYGQKPDQ